jgi:thiamine biosynthesis lipoprotein
MSFKNWFILIVVFVLIGCEPTSTEQRELLSGKTMGTTYSIRLPKGEVSQTSIDSILVEINHSVSTYNTGSLISKFNQDSFGVELNLDDNGVDHFLKNIEISHTLNQISDGAFDPSVMPLVNLWGFGYQENGRDEYPDSNSVDSVLTLIGFENFKVQKSVTDVTISKAFPGFELDFSAVAKGYAVDVIAEYIAGSGVENFMVEIGGEVVCRGQAKKNRKWVIGINKPVEGAGTNELKAKVELMDQAMATSGNYRNFYEVDGKKVSHSINPKLGYPEQNALLSASIVHRACANADAMATACMVLGLEKAKELVNSQKGYEGFFISGGPNGEYIEWQSSGFPNIQIIK